MASSSGPSAANPLLYSCIAHNTTILTEHATSPAAHLSPLVSTVLAKVSHSEPHKLTYTHHDNFIHYIADGATSCSHADAPSAPNLTYLVIAPSTLGKRVPFGFLAALKARFLRAYDPARTAWAALPPHGAAAFNSHLKHLMLECAPAGPAPDHDPDPLRTVQLDVDRVRNLMAHNIDAVLRRGETIALLVDKTDRLGAGARDFRLRSRAVRRSWWWKNVRLTALLAAAAVFLVYFLVGMGCGLPAWRRCVA